LYQIGTMAFTKTLLKIETHVAPSLDGKTRLQDYAVGIFRTIISRKGIKKAIKNGLVSINSERGYTGDWIMGGEVIELYRDPNLIKPSIDLFLEVLYEDDYLAIVSKPAGILVSGNKKFTLENALSSNLTKSEQPDALQFPEPIHRLDYPTTGALLIGKTTGIVMALNKLFEDRAISKIYNAVVIGTINDFGIISAAVDGKPSRTEYRKIATIPSAKHEFLNLLELIPHTGRRHQLRKHLAGIGNPIFGDVLYNKERGIVKGKGLYLHAFSLKFDHPVTKEKISIRAPLPKKFHRLFPQA
jgi:23S rRNA pseudouridine1911/1915/1917 synthase